jgi:endoglucanase
MDHDLLALVSNTPGVSGYEDPIQEVVADFLRPLCDEVRRDRLGNVIALRRATVPSADSERPLRVMLAAHADENGMMVKQIDGDGHIRFQRVGGLNSPSLTSQLVTIHGRRPVRGVIVPDTKGDKLTPVDDLLIDVALPREEVCELVEVGDIITLAQEFVALNDKVVLGRNFDDRLGTYCLLEAMRRVGPTAVDVYAVSTVQEEVGVRGAHVATFAVAPDLGLAIDGSLTHGGYVKPHDSLCALGKGTGIYIMDGLTLGAPRLLRFLYDLCAAHGITYQRNIGGGTDASAMQRSREGALVTTVGAPTRYMHSTVQLAHVDDIEATVALLVAFLEHAHEMEGAR